MTDGDRPLDLQIGELCDVCGRYYRMHYLVPDDVWARISLGGDGSGKLCLTCADKRARQVGIELDFVARRKRRDLSCEEISAARARYQTLRSEEQDANYRLMVTEAESC